MHRHLSCERPFSYVGPVLCRIQTQKAWKEGAKGNWYAMSYQLMVPYQFCVAMQHHFGNELNFQVGSAGLRTLISNARTRSFTLGDAGAVLGEFLQSTAS